MREITFIRHGKTLGNIEKRYTGTTNEALTKGGIEELEEKVRQGVYPIVDRVYSSPMLRCTQTAGLIYPTEKAVIVAELRETDFGDFENKNFEELENNPSYRKWIDSKGDSQFSGGESSEDFTRRCVLGFEKILNTDNSKSIGVVCHGGTIMTLLNHYTTAPKDFYFWQVENNNGYKVLFSTEKAIMRDMKKLW